MHEPSDNTTDMMFQPTATMSVAASTSSGNYSSTTMPRKPAAKKSSQKVGEHYVVQKMLGQSYICRVHLATDERDGKSYAVKGYPKKLLKDDRQKFDALRREVSILQRLRGCKYVQSLREVLNGESHFYIVVEFVSSILTDKVIDAKHLPEDQARKYFQQLIVALHYFREKRVVFKDFKLDKILIDSATDSIKVTGFDVAEIQNDGELLPTCFTTFANSAPEVLSGEEYDGFSADLFALVSSVLFPMLFGSHPFENAKKSVTFSNIENCEFEYPHSVFSVSDEAKDFIEAMLVADPQDRLDLQGILDHPWFKKGFEEYEKELQNINSSNNHNEKENDDDENDAAMLDKLTLDEEIGDAEAKKVKTQSQKNNNLNNISFGGSPAAASTTTTTAMTLSPSSSSTGDEYFDKLLAKFPPNFIFASSDIEIHGGSIGAGGAGSVFKARIKSVGWDVAAKLFRDRESVEKAIVECEQSLKLRHKNLVQTVGLAVAKSSFSTDLVMLMELGEESLDAVLLRQRNKEASLPFSFAQAWSYSKQIAEGLAFLHTRFPRVLHLDTKPSNAVLFQRGQVVKICDLGISRICDSVVSTSASNSEILCANVTRAGVGTLRYCSPEQLSSTTVDARCDVYSLGATIFAMIDEKFEPWSGKSVGEITAKGNYLVDTLKPREGCPQKLVDICKLCLAKKNEDRPKDAIDVFKMFLEPSSNSSSSEEDQIPSFLKEYEQKLKLIREHQQNQQNQNATDGMVPPQPTTMTLDELLAGNHTSSSSSVGYSVTGQNNNSGSGNNTGVSLRSEETETFRADADMNWTSYNNAK